MHLNKKSKTFIGIIVLLVVARIALPYVVLKVLNKTLAEDAAPYTGHIGDVDIALYRGAYRIIDMRIEVVENEVREPFLYVPAADLSVEWKSIFKGAITGEVVVEQPEVVFSFSESGDTTQEQTGEAVDWVTLVQDLMPITINRFAIDGGTATLKSIWADPQVDLSVRDINAELLNIRNVVDAGTPLPSPFEATANFPGYGGSFSLTGSGQLLKEIPDFNYDAKLENFALTEMNDLALSMAGIDFEKGTLSIYSELAMANGNFKGYVKPLLRDVQIFSRNEGDRTIGQFFKELFAEGIQELLENHKKDQLASRVPLTGTIENTKVGIYTAIISVVRNAYFNAFRPQIDANVEFADAVAEENGTADKPGFFKRIFGGGDDVDDIDSTATSPPDTTEKRGLINRVRHPKGG